MREPSSAEESAATHPSRAAGSLRIVPGESRAPRAAFLRLPRAL